MIKVAVKLKHPEGKRAYCYNAKEIVEEAESRNLTRAQIAQIAAIDTKTVSVWKKVIRNEDDGTEESIADPKSIQRLADYLNSMTDSHLNSASIDTSRSDLPAIPTVSISIPIQEDDYNLLLGIANQKGMQVSAFLSKQVKNIINAEEKP